MEIFGKIFQNDFLSKIKGKKSIAQLSNSLTTLDKSSMTKLEGGRSAQKPIRMATYDDPFSSFQYQ